MALRKTTAALTLGASRTARGASAEPFGSDDFEGAVYVMTNDLTRNEVVAYGRDENGLLTFLGDFPTGGRGSTDFDGPEGLDPLISAYAVELSDDRRFLFTVNAGSNTISSFFIRDDLTLSLRGVVKAPGVGPNSIAYRDGVIVVSAIDADGVFAGEPDQEGAIQSYKVAPFGALIPLPRSRRVLENRPSSVRFSPDGRFLVVSSINAGSSALVSGSNDELVVYGVDRFGFPTDEALSAATSTEVNNVEGRNLPSAIGIEVVEDDGRQFVVATEAREFQPNGLPPAFPELQAGSASTWELSDDGGLSPISLDVVSTDGYGFVDGERTVCWIAYEAAGEEYWTSNPLDSSISSYAFNEGVIELINSTEAQGNEVTSPDPAIAFGEESDGFLDIDTSDDGEYLYVLAGLRGEVYVYETEDDGGLSLIQIVGGDLPEVDTQGIAAF
ncbi:MAG: hypothetical protein ACFB00_01380 [Parvularculaceae bacterium]